MKDLISEARLLSRPGSLKHPKYRADIDGLRAVAVLAVVVFHAFPSWLRGGFIGVDVFFVISGFLISTIIFENHDSERFSFIEFYSRRIRRIFPALILVLLACFAMGWGALFADEYQQLAKHIAGGAGFASNLLLWLESGYFDGTASSKPLLHLWSLGVEEQFYIFWPFLLFIFWKWRFNLLNVTVTVAVLSFLLNVSVFAGSKVAIFYSPLTRFWELLLGAMLAYVSLFGREGLPRWQQNVLSWLGRSFVSRLNIGDKGAAIRDCMSILAVTLLLIGLSVIDKTTFYPGWWAMLPTLATVMFIAAGPQALLNRKVLSHPVLVGIGLISFPLYLWHWPLLSFTRIIQGAAPTVAQSICIIILSFILSWVTYRFFERPFRFGQYGRLKAGILLLVMVAVGGLACLCYLQGGFKGRIINKVNPVRTSGWDGGAMGHLVPGCGILKAAERNKIATCQQDARDTPKYALLGDSKAAALYRGLIRTSTEQGRWLVIGGHGPYGSPAPVLSDKSIYKSYQELTTLAIDALANNPDIETVAFMTATRVLFQLKSGARLHDLPASKNYQVALEGLSKATDVLIGAGKKIILIVDNPTLPDPEDCLERRVSSDYVSSILPFIPNKDCFLPLARHLELTQQYRALLLEVQAGDPQNIRIFDTTPSLCDIEEGMCLASKNGRRLYWYSDHISDYAAGLIGERLNSFIDAE